MTDSNTMRRPGDGLRRAWAVPFALLVIAQTALVLTQAILAGQFLEGSIDARDAHRTIGEAVLTLTSMALIVAAVVLWRPGHGPWWPILAAVLLFFLGGLQIGMGTEGNLEVHIPLGVSLFGINVALAMWVLWLLWKGPRTA